MESRLTIDLFAPGMGPLHRAGLGGLAATIDKLKLSFPHLSYTERTVELVWDEAEGSKPFFKRFYEQAFGLKEGLIHLPGSYGQVEPRPEVKAALQQGMSLTILQFGPNRKASGVEEKKYEIDDQPMIVSHQYLTNYTHRTAWQDLFTAKGIFKKQVSISGTIAPGFVQRHVAFPSSTIEQPPGHAIALHFALVGTLSLPLDRKCGVLLVPEVEDLQEFARLRGSLTPRDARACQVANPADAALQAQARVRAAGFQSQIQVRKTVVADQLGLKRCQAVLFTSQSWNEKQKTRADVLDVAPSLASLVQFEKAMKELPPRLIVRPVKEDSGERPPAFWAESLIRPLVADNLARGQPWFQNFRSLLVGDGDLNAARRFRQLEFEREGLIAMQQLGEDDRGEEYLITAIHEAMSIRYRMIKRDAKGDPTTTRNRWARQMERWRLRTVGAKRPDDLRAALSEMWGKGVTEIDGKPQRVRTLTEHWREVRPILSDSARWELNRDLVVLALVSYSNPKKKSDAAPVVLSGAVDDDV